MTFGKFADSEALTEMERKQLAEALIALRRRETSAANVSFSDMQTAVRVAAYRAERRAAKTFDENDLREMEALDAVGNMLLAITVHLDQVMPILKGYVRKWKARGDAGGTPRPR